MLSEIYVNLIAGLLATILGILLSIFWRKLLNPWIEDKIYKEHRLDSEDWIVFVEDKATTATVKIAQKGHKVHGTITETNASGHIVYDFIGEYRNGILTSEYSICGKHSVDRGTFTLQRVRGGKVLNGYYAWHDGNSAIISGKYTWCKSSFAIDYSKLLNQSGGNSGSVVTQLPSATSP